MLAEAGDETGLDAADVDVDGDAVMLILLIVNFGEALPLSPKRTRM